MLSFALPPLIFVGLLRDQKKGDAGKEGYEAVPLVENGDEETEARSGAVGRDEEEGEDLHKRRSALV